MHANKESIHQRDLPIFETRPHLYILLIKYISTLHTKRGTLTTLPLYEYHKGSKGEIVELAKQQSFVVVAVVVCC